MDAEKKKRIKDKAPTWGAVLISVCTAIGGVASFLESREKAQEAEQLRVRADTAVVDGVFEEIDRLRDGVDADLDTLFQLAQAKDKRILELEIRVAVLQTLMEKKTSQSALEKAVADEVAKMEQQRRALPTLYQSYDEPADDQVDAALDAMEQDSAPAYKRVSKDRPAAKPSKEFLDKLQETAF